MAASKLVRNLARFSLLLTLALALSACSLQHVKPWQKGELAKPAMALDGRNLETRFANHSYESREAARGGAGVGGGGCGCN